MLGSSLVLATGFMLLVVARLSGRPSDLGVVVLAGFVLVGVACARHFGEIIDRATVLPRFWRLVTVLVGWLAIGGGTFALIGRAPGAEVLVGFALFPLVLGGIGLAATRREPWAAAAFLGLAVAQALFLGLVLLARGY